MTLSKNALQVLEKRYLKKDKDGKIVETPNELFSRVAQHIAKAEEKYGNDPKELETIFYDMMVNGEFLPNSPTLMNAGKELGQLAACFVLPIEDSMDGIFDALKNAALIFKSGGGVGYSFSNLRPKNSIVGTTGGVASGPVSFMKIFNEATEQIKQGGLRKGASIAVLRVDHPDILEFITCKANNNTLNNFNISVSITDEFMKCVKENTKYNLIDPRKDNIVGRLNAREVYQKLVENAWLSGDPGIVFIDMVNKNNPTPKLGKISAVNPCSENPLLEYEQCTMGSINLSKFFDGEKIDYKELKYITWAAVRFLDNVVDMSKYPLPEIEKISKDNRKIGLGIMGFADLLFKLNIPYNSMDGLNMAEEIMSFIQVEAHKASEELAEERGSFPNYEDSIYGTTQHQKRNATITTIAPTGTLSIIADCSSGIEPLFALGFTRTVMDNNKLIEVNRHFQKVAEDGGFYTEEIKQIIAEKGSIQEIKEIPEEVKKVFVTAHDISPEWHVRMQATFQKHLDNSISKTVNLSKDATVEDVKKVYDLAYELGCKGVTVYRDGSKKDQVLSFSSQTATDGFSRIIKDRPETLDGFTTKIITGLGHLYVTVTEYGGRPFEVFATIGKSGRSTTAKTEAIGRLCSLALRSGIEVEKIVEQLKGICGEHPIFGGEGMVLSIPDAIGKILEKRYLKKQINVNKNGLGNTCPECGNVIVFEEGCMICHSCGYSKCG